MMNFIRTEACGCGSKPLGSHFGVGAPPILVYFSGDWDVHWGCGILTHGHVAPDLRGCEKACDEGSFLGQSTFKLGDLQNLVRMVVECY